MGILGDHPIVRDILAQPERERLTYALEALRWILGRHDAEVAAYTKAFGLSDGQARALRAVVSASPGIALYGSIMTVACKPDTEDPKVVRVLMCHIRSRAPGLAIQNHWGMGYSISTDEAQRIRGIVRRHTSMHVFSADREALNA